MNKYSWEKGRNELAKTLKEKLSPEEIMVIVETVFDLLDEEEHEQVFSKEILDLLDGNSKYFR